MITVALLYPVMIYFERKRQSAAEVSYHVRFTACMLIGKLALSATSALLVSALPPAVYLLCCIGMLLLFLHLNNQRGAPLGDSKDHQAIASRRAGHRGHAKLLHPLLG